MNARSIMVPFLVLVIATSGLMACASAPNKDAAAAATVAAARSTEAAAEATKAAAAQIIAQATRAIQVSPTSTPITRATQSPSRTATVAPTQAPPTAAGTAEPQGQRFYLQANGILALTPPPSNSQSHTECFSECIQTWAITLTHPLQGNAYGYDLVSISGSYNVRLLHTRGGQQTVLAEWLNRSGWQGGPQVDALPGDVLTLEVTVALGASWRPSPAGSLLAYDYGSYSYVTIGTTPTPLPTFPAPPKPTPVVLDTSAAVQIHCGEMITQTIKSSGDVGIYAFDGKTGDIAFILAVGTEDASWLEPQVKLFDPQGKPVAAGSEGRGEYKLTADGRYVFTVRDAGTRIGPYNVLLKNASPGAGTRLTYDTSISTRITVTRDVHIYSFMGRAGDVVRIAMTENSADSVTRQFAVEFLDPNRKSLGGGTTWVYHTVIIEKTLTTDGEYTVKVYATGTLNTPTTGPYALLVKNVAVAAGTRLTYGDVVTGTITPQGDKDVYVFEWKAGEKVVLEASGGQFFSLQVELFDSRGNSLAKGQSSYAQPVIQIKPLLSEAGLYIVTVENPIFGASFATGSYTLSLKNLATP